MEALPQLLAARNGDSAEHEGLTLECIRRATGKFDVGTVFKLHWTGHGLQDMSGMDRLVNLIELDLSNNSISKIHGLNALGNLRKLVLTCNRIQTVEALSCVKTLQHLFLQKNPIVKMDNLNLAMLSGVKSLRSLYLRNIDGAEACPVCSHKEYKVAVLSALPHLTNLDGERNPHTCVYLDTLDQTHQSHEKLKQYDPEFKYDPPEPWFTPDVLMVPPVTFPDARRSLCVALEVAGKRIIRLESELHATQKLIFQRQ